MKISIAFESYDVKTVMKTLIQKKTQSSCGKLLQIAPGNRFNSNHGYHISSTR